MQIKIQPKSILIFFSTFFCCCLIFLLGFLANKYFTNLNKTVDLLNPFVNSDELVSRPLIAYSIKNLQERDYKTSKVLLEKIITKEEKFTSYLFSYQTLNKRMTGQINIPNSITDNPEKSNEVIVMLRGYVPKEIYTTGMGTKNVAAALANANYITVAPDFFGFGESDPEPDDTWQARFEKPITVIELIKSLEEFGVPIKLTSNENVESENNDEVNIKADAKEIENDKESEKSRINTNAKISKIGLWAHSNGGQIALTTLEILQKPIPTTLWAPVTAPFPYSILYFSDELEDEGKEQRKWISLFEENYNVFDFSLTKHLDSLTGPIQIQHGNNDDAALIFWSQEFIAKVETENEHRQKVFEDAINSSTKSANIDNEMLPNKKDSEANETLTTSLNNDVSEINNPKILDKIEINLITYQNTNHNMVPNWDNAVQRDLMFFDNWLK